MNGALDSTAVAELTERFSGAVLGPQDPGYDEARRVHNGSIDKRPALIARCRGTADVVDAVRFATEHGLEIAVRGGGHNVAGRAVCEGGLMIDLAPMKGISVDAERRTARAQGGVTWREFNRETQLHGLATTGGVISTTGIAGLTLGGGIGYLMGMHGLSIDNLIGAEVVTATGEVLRADAENHADLFWALRGGGGNFGVVTWLEYRLHPVGPMVTGGLVAHPFEAAGDVLRFFRDTTPSWPDELTGFAGLVHAPDGSGAPIVAVVAVHCGSPEEGEEAVAPIKAFGSPILDAMGPMSYEATASFLDEGYPAGARNYWKSNFLQVLDDDAIDTMIARFASCPSPMSGLAMEHVHGAVTRVGLAETPFPFRHEGYNLLITSEWLEPEEDEPNIAWTRETYDALRPHFADLRYVNYLDDDEDDPAASAYGPNHDRLRAVKATYDPENLFHLNQNIRP